MTARRRLLHLVHYCDFGGPHNQALRLAEPLGRRGWETIVAVPDEPGSAALRLEEAGIEVIRVPLTRLRATLRPDVHARFLRDLRRDVVRLRREIEQREIDLVVVTGLVNPQGAVAASGQGVAVVWQLLDTRAPVALRRALMPLVRARADVVMSTGRLVAEAHPGIDRLADRLVPFVPPVDTNDFRPDDARRRAARAELELEDSAYVVGTLGVLTPMKDHELFLTAAAELQRQAPDIRFVVLGAALPSHARHAERLRALADELSLVGIRFIEPGGRAARLLPALDLFWLTSKAQSEGIPTAIGEAMAVGIPVVATAVGGVSEVIESGRTGFVLLSRAPSAFVHATLQLIDDPRLAVRMATEARVQAERLFGVETCADVHASAFARAVARSTNGA